MDPLLIFYLQLHADAYAAAQRNGIQDIRLSLSYCNNTVIAVALAMRGDEEPTY